jgi:hypothetical protein
MGELEASHTVEIEASLEAVYAVAANVAGAVEWQPSVVSIDVIEEYPDGTAKLVELEADAVVKKAKSVLRYEYSPPSGISWVQEQGDTKSLTGQWELVAIDDGRTRATYALTADPGRMLGMLLRGPVEGKVKDFLTRGAAEGLKEHCESS